MLFLSGIRGTKFHLISVSCLVNAHQILDAGHGDDMFEKRKFCIVVICIL